MFGVFPAPVDEAGLLGLMVVLVGLWVAVPLQAYLVYRLAKATGKNPVVWCCGTLVPYAGLLVLVLLNTQATAVLKAAGLHAPPFRSWRRPA